MLTVPTLLLCFALLLSFIDLSYTRPSGHRRPRRNSEVSKLDMKCDFGSFNSATKNCDCEIGFSGPDCKIVESRRCNAFSSQAQRHQLKPTCPMGQWCVPDNINCLLYVCDTAEGWCIPQAKNLRSDSSTTAEASPTTQFFDEFYGVLT